VIGDALFCSHLAARYIRRQVLDTALRVWIVAAVVVGAAFIVLSDPVVTSVGVLLIIFRLLSPTPVVADFPAVEA